MSKASLGFLCGLVGCLLSAGVRAAPDRFELEVRPNPLAVNQAVDLIVKVMDKNGDIVKEYDKDIFIEAEKLSDSEVELPGAGIYQFQPSDQGNKIFSKGLIIKKEGTFKIMVSDIIDEKIKGEVTVVVKKDGAGQASGYITVISPVAGSIESEPAIHIYGRSELENSPLEIYMDNTKIKDTKTSNNGDFSVYINDLTSGAHLLQVKVKDLNNTVIGSSDEIPFTYINKENNLFKALDILPSPVVNISTKVTVLLKTAETVSTAELIFPDAKKIILDTAGPGEFRKEFIADKTGSYPLSVKLTTDSIKKQYDKVKTLTVLGAVALGPIKALRVQEDPSQIDLNWTYSGDIQKFRVIYGISADKLDLEVLTQTPSLTISQTDTSQTYYFKIYPQDDKRNDIGSASDIVQVGPITATTQTAITPTASLKPAVCVIDNIHLNSKQIGDTYYITRNKAPGAIRYNIYRSESKTENLQEMSKVGETIETQFEYPFDPHASKELYAYYRVEGICADNQTTKISNIKQVKVGPKENLMILGLIGMMIYAIFQLKNIKRSGS